MADTNTERTLAAGSVQSLSRALDVLELVSDRGGHLAIGEIAELAGIPLPTAHRLLKTLIQRGYMRQLPNRRYALGYRLVPLGAAANSMLWAEARPALARLVDELGETANLATLADGQVEYVAQVSSPHHMRMFTEVGRRVGAHCTGVGKALLAQIEDSEVESIVRRHGMAPQTQKTITTEPELRAELERVRSLGYAIDDEEQELGVRCIAVPIRGRFLTPLAISVSGPLARVDMEFVDRAVPLLLAISRELTEKIAAETGSPSN